MVQIINFLNYPNFLSLKVLDVGCGKCQLLSYLSDKHGMKNLSGIDLMSMEYEAPSNIDFFNENFLGHKPISKYDVIISTLVIEHVYNANEFLSKIKSMLTPNGIAIIVTNDCSHPLYLSARLLSKLNFKQPLQRMFSSHHVNHFTKKTLKLLSGKVGFRFLRTISVSIPYKSLDIPCENFLQKIIYPYAVYVHLTLGKIINHKFLQMQIYIN